MTVDKDAIRILIVDDYRTMLRIIRNFLESLGFTEIDEAADGSAAIERLRKKRYDLVISDWNMSPVTGLDLLRTVRADKDLRLLPFIMVTAEAQTAKVAAAKEAGVSDYLVKPFNAAALRSKLAAIFGEI